MVWVIAFGELFFGGLWCVVWGYGGMRTHFSLLNPRPAPWRCGSFCFITWQCSASRGIAGRGSAVLHLWPGFGHLSMVSRDLSMVFRHLCARCGCYVCTCRCAVHLWPGYSESMGELCIDKTTNQLPCFSNVQQQVATRSNRHQPGPAARLTTSLSRHGRTSNTPAQPLPGRIRLAWPCTWSIGASAPRRLAHRGTFSYPEQLQ